MGKSIIFTEGMGAPVQTEPQPARAFDGIADGSLLLQNAFTSLFEQEIPHLKTVFLFEMHGGWWTTLYRFAAAISTDPDNLKWLLVDYSDIPGELKENKLNTLSQKVELQIAEGWIPPLQQPFSTYFDAIFFMVQKMEAWILSQPEVIDHCYGHLKRMRPKYERKKAEYLSKPASSIPNPDKVLDILIQCFEKSGKGGVLKKMKYEKGGKVRLAYELLTKLELKKLMDNFEDVKSLVERLKAVST